MSEEEEKKKKIISIRGLDEKLYKQLLILSKEMGKTVGEVTNEAIKLYLAIVRGSEIVARRIAKATSELARAFMEGLEKEKVRIIRYLDELSISKRDLEESDKPISFISVKKLKFEPDVNAETFTKHVDTIIFCDELLIPKSLPKTIVGSKCRFVKKITTYEA